MADFVRLLIDIVQFLWPFRRVEHWERGVRYWMGRAGQVVGPGVYPVIPWFGEVRTAPVAEFIIGTGRLDLAIKDGTVLSFAATATAQVSDVFQALNAVNEYQETATEAFMSACADQLAEETAASLEPSRRTRMMKRVQAAVAGKLSRYGIEVLEVNFISLVPNARVHRLVIDQMEKISF